jgi:DNA repair protein RecN (Recombination protein N)
MLRYLRISDFALIRSLEVEFGPGLNLLTGETGSGKSIIVDALGLLIGGRSSQDMIRSGCNTAAVEGIFDLERGSRPAEVLELAGIQVEDNALLIRREISLSGKNRIFLNHSPATASLLRSVAEGLVDIHGQHEHETLLDSATHLLWLDRFGANQDAVAAVRQLHRRMKDIAARVESMTLHEQERLRRLDVLEFQLEEIRRAGLQPQEKEELESERRLLANREKLIALTNEAYGILYDSESAIISQSNRLERILAELEPYDVLWTAHLEALREAIYRLEDLAYAARDYGRGIDFRPERLEEVEQRLAEIARLGKKYGGSIAEILDYRDRCAAELQELSSYREASQALTEELSGLLAEYRASSGEISGKRRTDAMRLETEIRREFRALSMEKMELTVQFQPLSTSSGELIPAAYGPDGTDHVEFLIRPNRGEDAKPLARIASGGELSRIMLAMKTLCKGDDAGRTLVFDEVDAGIGGRVAETVGKRLSQIADNGSQVLCVTHLPQIAAFAAQHFSVRKSTAGERTETSIDLLAEQGRVEELARMLGGAVLTQTTRKHAAEMLAHSQAVLKEEVKE